MGMQDSLAPILFVSYSRRQLLAANLARDALRASAHDVWMDLEQLVPGDRWRAEIEDAIARCDELVVLVSDESAHSAVVQWEVERARAAGRLVRPFLIESMRRELPGWLSDTHFENLLHVEPSKLGTELARRLGAVGMEDASAGAALKWRATRRIHPPFRVEYGSSASSRAGLQKVAAELEALRARAAVASPVWLNAGLAHCLTGNWDAGLRVLREHARVSDTQAAWYFVALHGLRARSARSVSISIVQEVSDAIARADDKGPNALVALAAAVLESEGSNHGPERLREGLRRFEELDRCSAEEPGEYARLLWSFKASLETFPERERARVLSIIRSRVR